MVEEMAEAPASRRASTSDFSLDQTAGDNRTGDQPADFFHDAGHGTGQYFYHVGADMAELLLNTLKSHGIQQEETHDGVHGKLSGALNQGARVEIMPSAEV